MSILKVAQPFVASIFSVWLCSGNAFAKDLIRTAISGPEISPFCLVARAAQEPTVPGFSVKYDLEYENITLALTQYPIATSNGDVDMAQCSGISTVINAWAKGGRGLFVFAFGAQAPVYQLIVQPTIKSLADMKGKIAGIQGIQTAGAEAIEMILKRGANLLSEKDYNFVNVGVNSASIAAMMSKNIDAIPFYPPFSYGMERQGFNVIADESTYVPQYVTGTHIVNRAWAEKNKPLFVRYMKSLIETGQWFRNPANEAAAIDWLIKHISSGDANPLDKASAKKVYDFYIKDNRLALDGSVPESAVRANLDILKERGYITDADIPPLGQVVDYTYLNQARQELGLPPVESFAK